MRRMLIVSVLALIVVRQLDAQRGEAPPRSGPVTFAINVTDAAGAPIGDVTVNLSGPVTRTTRTERGRTVFESLPTGTYKFRFEKAGYVTLEREVAGRGAKPIDVKVSLESVPEPAPPPKPVEVVPPPPPPVDVKLAVLDMLPFIEKNYIGKAAGKTTPMGCATGGSSTLLQVNEPLALHTHDDADEFIYVISGQGIARLSGREESLGPAVFLMIPRGMPHTLSAGAKKPLVMMSIRAGDKCR